MIATTKISMDLTNLALQPLIDVMQDDKYSRNIEIALHCSGPVFIPPEGTQVLVRYCKPDGKNGMYDTMPDGSSAWSITENVVTVRLAPQTCTVPGKVLLTVTLICAEAELHCFTVCLHVHPLPKGTLQSESYINVTGFLPQPDQAAPGQYLQVSAVNSSGKVTALQAVNAPTAGGRCPERLYVEDYKTADNTWNDAFEALFADCLLDGCVACTGFTYYALTRPLYIGNIDVDFENCELFNNMAESETNPACVVLTGAEGKIQKFGTVTGRQSIGILVNTEKSVYKFNRLYAKLLRGYINALCISTTNYAACFNEFHVLRLRSSTIPLKVHCISQSTKWANEMYFYLGSIESYRDINPVKLIEMTNVTRSNIYNVDLECIVNADAEGACEVELTDCQSVAFYNPRTAEGYNAVQFRFIGESYNNFIDAEYCKYATIDSSQMVMSDVHYNVWRGYVSTGNSGAPTNASRLRIYKNMIVPEMLSPMVRNVESAVTVTGEMLSKLVKVSSWYSLGGIPTLLKWSSGDITIDKRFIALMPVTIQIMRVADNVGNIVDTDGNVILAGSELEANKRYDIRVDSITYALTDVVGEHQKVYPYYSSITVAIV